MDDSMINLIKGHMATSDKDFVFFVKTKKEEHDEGKDISEDRLTKLELNKYTNNKRDGE